MIISEKVYNKLPSELKVLFDRLPNPAKEEVVAKFPQSSSGASGRNLEESSQANFIRLKQKNVKSGVHFGDSGSAARFFFVVKEFDSDGC
jgi:hypothetical protein